MTDNGDRLSRIEAILEGLARQSVEADQRLTQRFAEADQRLTRIERAQVQLQQQFAEADQRLTRIEQAIDETRKIADSNARSIQAWSATIADDRAEREQVESELRVDINGIRQTLAQTAELQQTLLNAQLRDRDEWRQQRTEVNQQIQALIDTQNQDRQEWQQQREQLSATMQDSQQQIQSLIALSRENTREHAEFRADIRRIWEQLAG